MPSDERVFEIDGKDDPEVLDLDLQKVNVIRINVVHHIEFEDVCFNPRSAVFLPLGIASGRQGQDQAVGLAALAAVIDYATKCAAADPPAERYMLIAGHTDTKGDDAANLTLSADRADGVRAFIEGEGDVWAEISDCRHVPDDLRAIFAWLAATRGWPCEPGDGADGYVSALRAFRGAGASLYESPPAEDDPMGPPDWKAIYACYRETLCELLSMSEADLPWPTFVDRAPPCVGCGERWPLHRPGEDGVSSRSNRRVEVLFFDEREVPDLACHDGGGKADCPLYGDPTEYDAERVKPIEGEGEAVRVTFTPRLTAERLVVLLDRKLSAHQGAAETKLHPTPTWVDLSLTHDPDRPPVLPAGARLRQRGARVEAFEDAECTVAVDLTKPIPLAKLTGEEPLRLHLRGAKAGPLTLRLELDDPSDARFLLKDAADSKLELGVVELKLTVHEQDAVALADLRVDPDVDPIEDYYRDLAALPMPAQVVVSDAEKVSPKGRLLHVQRDGNHGRAKVTVSIDASQWPSAAQEYSLVVHATNASGATTVYDAEEGGSAQALPLALRVADLVKGEVVLWVEGRATTQQLGDVRLDLGLAGEDPKRNGDWGRFTVVEIAKVTVVYRLPPPGGPVPWDAAKKRQYINVGSRKVAVRAELSEPLEGVPIHVMLAPHEDNRKAANWGVDLPADWLWHDIDWALKRSDKRAPDKLTHWAKVTRGDGAVTLELELSRFAGDRFTPAAYLSQDPHLAKYMPGQAALTKRAPKLSEASIQVWRRLWYQMTVPKGLNAPAPTLAEDAYLEVRTELTKVNEVEFDATTTPVRTWYPEWQLKPTSSGGGTVDVAVIGDHNQEHFFALATHEAKAPLKAHLVICQYQYDQSGTDTPGHAVKTALITSGRHVDLDMGKTVLDPPLQGGDVLIRGRWWLQSDASVDGRLSAADVTVRQDRGRSAEVRVTLPVGAPEPTPAEPVRVRVKVQVASGPWLGLSDKTNMLVVYDPSDPVDYNNTVTHEIGHSLGQVCPTGVRLDPEIPNHGHHYYKDGDHCAWSTDLCVMYEAGPVVGSINKYCEECHPYVLAQDMSAFV